FLRALQDSADQSTIDLQRCASDVRRGIGQEKRGRTAELVRVAVTPQRDRRRLTLLLFLERHARPLAADLVELPEPVGLDAAGNEGVDADSMRRELDRERLGKRSHR